MWRGRPEPLGELSPSTLHTLWSLVKESTEDSFLILNFSILREKQKSFTGYCVLSAFPFPALEGMDTQGKLGESDKAGDTGENQASGNITGE